MLNYSRSVLSTAVWAMLLSSANLAFAAPIAARLVGKIPVKKVLIGVGLLVILTSTNTLVNSVIKLMHPK